VTLGESGDHEPQLLDDVHPVEDDDDEDFFTKAFREMH
jgi:hypothetical protein